MQRRQLDVVVISDVHLGTHGCHSAELVAYLKSIEPKVLILNGDIIDGWQFSKHYFPHTHFAVIKEILSLIPRTGRIVYITGNHDEILRKYSPMELGNLVLADKYILEINNQKMWVFHGDVFDNTTTGSAKVLAKMGSKGYDLLILLNRAINLISKKLGKDPVSFSKKIKDGVKSAVKYINNFERIIADLAIENGFDYVICGHIHQPCKKDFSNGKGQTVYLNSGDWVENLSALEYHAGEWEIFYYAESDLEAAGAVQLLPKSINILPEDTDPVFWQNQYR
jgi:UDP-2,3-diacylglucosamine pyrophosphatase LpxH